MARLDSDLLNYKSKYIKNGLLKNKLDITDSKELEKLERLETSYKLSKLYLNPGKQTFDMDHYLSIHKYLFENIYDFAGQIRNEVINKEIPFCLPHLIADNLQSVLRKSNKIIPSLTSRDKLLMHIVELYSDLDVIHPFREGNGRTEREFIRQYIEYICKVNNLESYYLDYSNVDRERYIKSVIKADAYLDYKDLFNLFDEILTVKEKNNKRIR